MAVTGDASSCSAQRVSEAAAVSSLETDEIESLGSKELRSDCSVTDVDKLCGDGVDKSHLQYSWQENDTTHGYHLQLKAASHGGCMDKQKSSLVSSAVAVAENPVQGDSEAASESRPMRGVSEELRKESESERFDSSIKSS